MPPTETAVRPETGFKEMESKVSPLPDSIWSHSPTHAYAHAYFASFRSAILEGGPGEKGVISLPFVRPFLKVDRG